MLLHHAHDRRSWTEIGTNFTYLATVDLEQDVDALLDWGRIPERILPAYLHEATHHWSFHSPVGAAIASLRLAVVSRALSLRYEQTDDVGQQLYDELIEFNRRLVVITELLRPMTEGLALFAEFDAIGQVGAMQASKPMMDATLLFANPPLLVDYTASRESMLTGGHEFLWQVTHEPLLLNLRTTPDCVQRKLNVLCSPLGSHDGGGYLVGYLAVCNMWKYLSGAMRHFELMRHSDAFMTFLNHYFFWDYGLVGRLLDPNVESAPALHAIAEHLTSRLRAFWTLEYEEVESFRTAELEIEEKDPLGLDPDLVAAGRRRLAEFNPINPATEATLPGLVNLLDDFSRNRDLLYLAQAPVSIEIKSGEYSATSESGLLIARGPVPDDEESFSGPGFIELYYSADDLLPVPMLRITLAAGETVGMQSSGRLIGIAGSSFERMKARLVSRSNAEEVMRMADELLVHLDSPERIDPGWARFKNETLPGYVDTIWQPSALASVPDEKRDECRDRMAEFGILGLDPAGGEQLEAFVLSSLVSSVTPYANSMKMALAARNYDLAEMWVWLERMWEEWGMPKIAGGNRFIQAQF